MSKLASGDEDFPEATARHLRDAGILLKVNRPDGAAYLAGYVVECGLKSLYLLENKDLLPKEWKIHGLADLASKVIAMTGSESATYLETVKSVAKMAIAEWNPSIRYRASGAVNAETAKAWLADAERVHNATFARMKLDGVL